MFQYNKDNSITPPENQISYVYKPSLAGKNTVDDEDSFDQIIGYRYYKSPGVNILDDNDKIVDQINPNEYFTVLNNKFEHKYEIYEKNNHDCYNIVQAILQNKLKSLKDYEIYGTDQETIGFLTAMQNSSQDQNVVIKIPDYDDLWKCEITKTSDNPESKDIITYFNSGDILKILNDKKLTEKQKEQALINKILMDLNFTEDEKQKGLAVIPFSVDSHSTTLMIKLKPETDRKMYIEDFSKYHLQDNQVRQNLLGKASEYCEVLNTSPIQLNGTCNFWMLAFCQVAKEYDTPDLLINDCKDGVIDIKVANKMREFFEMGELFSNVKDNTRQKKINIIRSNTDYYFNSEQIKNNLFLELDGLTNNNDKFNFDFEYIMSEEFNKIVEDQKERTEITKELGIIQENIEKYTRKLIRNDPIVLDLKKKFVELNNKLASTNNNDYESVNELYVEIIELENKMSNFPKEKKELYERYKTLLEETKIEEDFDIKKLITLVDSNNIESDDQRIENLKAKIETSFEEKLAELKKEKSKDNVDNYRIKKINDKRVENLAILEEKGQLSEIEQIQKEFLEEQQKSRNEKDNLKIEMLFKKLETINLIDVTKKNIPSQKEVFDRYLLSAEMANEELENLNLKLDIRDTKIKLCIEPSNEYLKAHLEDLKSKEIRILQNLSLLDKKYPAEQSSEFKNNDPKIVLLSCQRMLWDLENKFNRERFVDNRKEHEKSEIVTKSIENLIKPPVNHLSPSSKKKTLEDNKDRNQVVHQQEYVIDFFIYIR